MPLDKFRRSLADEAPPEGASPALTALWHQGRGDWQAAHEAVMSDGSKEAAWVHAHLHRVEGDESNAAYWYNRAGQPHCQEPLVSEWADLVITLMPG